MKKASLLFMAALAGITANAQNPLQVNKGMITKITATWCGPCGEWGWTMLETMIADKGSKNLVMTMYPSNSTSDNDKDFYSQIAADWKTHLDFGHSIYPTFGSNFKDHTGPHYDASAGTLNSGAIQSDIYADVDAFDAAPVVASTGYTYELIGNTINVKTKTKFWQAASGEYYVLPIIIENGTAHIQNVQGTGVVTKNHHNVMRASMAATSYGDQIASGSITANQTFTKDYSFTITDASWDKTKLKVNVLLLKKNGSNYDYVNGNDIYEWATSVKDINSIKNVAVYPNPANGYTDVSFATKESATINISVIDALGKIVFNSGNIHTTQPDNIYRISTSNMPTGVYNVIISTETDKTVQKLVVTN